MLYRKERICKKINKKLSLFIILSTSVSLIAPFVAFFDISKRNGTDQYYKLQSSRFASSLFAKYYATIEFVIETILPIVLLIIFSLIAKAKFHNLVNRGTSNLVTAADDISQMELRFSKMILISTFVFLCTRIIDFAASLPTRLVYFSYVEASPGLVSVARLMRQLSSITFVLAHSLSSVFYFRIDQNLRKLLTKIFRKFRVCCISILNAIYDWTCVQY